MTIAIVSHSRYNHQEKYVVAWAAIHQEELAALWSIMQTDGEYFKIKGLE